MSLSPEAASRGNYFAEGDYLTTDVKTGVMRNRAGTRMIALTSDFLLGLVNALNNECGPAADLVFKSCGRSWGSRFAPRFEKEVSDYYGTPLRDAPSSMFLGTLAAAFNHHGWGNVVVDLHLYDRGLILVTVTNAVYAGLVKKSDRPADPLLAGVLAGFFSHFAGQELDCIQTQCAALGANESRFVLGLESRLAPFADAAKQGQPHTRILADLEETSV